MSQDAPFRPTRCEKNFLVALDDAYAQNPTNPQVKFPICQLTRMRRKRSAHVFYIKCAEWLLKIVEARQKQKPDDLAVSGFVSWMSHRQQLQQFQPLEMTWLLEGWEKRCLVSDDNVLIQMQQEIKNITRPTHKWYVGFCLRWSFLITPQAKRYTFLTDNRGIFQTHAILSSLALWKDATVMERFFQQCGDVFTSASHVLSLCDYPHHFIFPLPMSLNRQELLQCWSQRLYPLGLTCDSVRADGVLMQPSEFFLHDVYHSVVPIVVPHVVGEIMSLEATQLPYLQADLQWMQKKWQQVKRKLFQQWTLIQWQDTILSKKDLLTCLFFLCHESLSPPWHSLSVLMQKKMVSPVDLKIVDRQQWEKKWGQFLNWATQMLQDLKMESFQKRLDRQAYHYQTFFYSLPWTWDGFPRASRTVGDNYVLLYPMTNLYIFTPSGLVQTRLEKTMGDADAEKRLALVM